MTRKHLPSHKPTSALRPRPTYHLPTINSSSGICNGMAHSLIVGTRSFSSWRQCTRAAYYGAVLREAHADGLAVVRCGTQEAETHLVCRLLPQRHCPRRGEGVFRVL